MCTKQTVAFYHFCWFVQDRIKIKNTLVLRRKRVRRYRVCVRVNAIKISKKCLPNVCDDVFFFFFINNNIRVDNVCGRTCDHLPQNGVFDDSSRTKYYIYTWSDRGRAGRSYAVAKKKNDRHSKPAPPESFPYARARACKLINSAGGEPTACLPYHTIIKRVNIRILYRVSWENILICNSSFANKYTVFSVYWD